MRVLSPGDIVFSFSDTLISKIGIVQGFCYESPRPHEFGAVGERAWSNIGWAAKVKFFTLTKPFKPKDHIEALRPHLPAHYSPLKPTGDGHQRYLSSVPDSMADALGALIGEDFGIIRGAAIDTPIDAESGESSEFESHRMWEDEIINEVNSSQTLDETTRLAIVAARVGQGQFRKNVSEIESHCCITRVSDPAHLRASHTKLWRSSTNEERLNGENGLLLTPTIDHLFDRGFISFKDNGELLISPVAYIPSLSLMGVPCEQHTNVGMFSSGQRRFLEYHWDNIFLSLRKENLN